MKKQFTQKEKVMAVLEATIKSYEDKFLSNKITNVEVDALTKLINLRTAYKKKK